MKIRKVVLLLIAVIMMTSSGFAPAFSQATEPAACDGQAASCGNAGETTSPVDPLAAEPSAKDLPGDVLVVRVYYNTVEDSQLLTGFDLFEYNNPQEKYFLAAVDRADLARLHSLGFRTEVDPEETANFARLATPLAEQTGPVGIESIPNYSCYRTVEETYAAAQALAAAHPDLATWIDVGDSWEKVTVTSPDLAGYDMMVLKLTNTAISGPKPKLFITASIHAREYAPAELIARFAEYLVNNYGTDADATWILDHHEIHLMFHANPDGRKKAEAGSSWRKNTDRDDGCSTTYGTDLNRNFSYQWGTGGSSAAACDETYRGPSAGSEPETQVIQNYLNTIFTDQRGTGAAPTDATGVYMDIHSYGGYVMWPWGYSTTDMLSPNNTQHQTLGRKFAYFNSYSPFQIADGLYIASGGSIDYAYAELGVASLCFEVGTAFFQSCTTFTGTIYPNNLPALIYAAKVVRTPYMTPAGPDALSLAVSPSSVASGDPATLTATINDTRYRQTNGTEPTQAIAAAEFYVDTPPWQAGAVANAMAASDGSFNATTENVTATVNTAGLAAGKHLVFVRGQDANGNWGAFSAVFLTVTGPANQAPTADAQSVTTSEDVAAAVTLTGSDPEGDPLTYGVVTGPSHGTLSGTAPNLTYTPAANYNGADSFTFVANDGHSNSAPATVSVTVTPVNDDAPVADAQSVTTQQDAAVAITLTGSDADGDTLAYAVTSEPTHGTLSGTAPNLTYTPDSGYTGDDSFTFVVSDGARTSEPATVSITINPPGPVTVFFDNFETDLGWIRNPSGTDTATLGVWERADPEAVDYYGYKQLGTTVSGSYDLVTGPLAGSSAGSYDLDGGATSIRSPEIALPAGSELEVSFSYYLANYTNASTADYLRVKVVGSTTQTVFEELAAADNDDAAWATFSGSLDEFGGQTIYLLIEAADASTASLVEAAVDDVLIIATGGSPNQTPAADPQSVSTAEDAAVAITLTGSDPDGNPLTYSVVAQPAHGALSGTAPALTYTPTANYHGADSFIFVVNDGVVDSQPATIDITVTPVNDAPVANPQSVTTQQDTAVAITLTGSDVDGGALTFSVVAGPTHGTLSGTAPNLTYTPAAGYTGADSFTFAANDGTVASDPAAVSITVTPVNHAPVANPQSVTTDEDGALAITLTGSDPDGNLLTYSVVAQPAHGSLSGAAPNLTYTPAANFNGADSFTFKVNDGAIDSEPAEVSITITPVNDAPVANPQPVTTQQDTPVAITLTGSDVDGGALTFSVVAGPTHGTLSGDGPSLTYTPTSGYSGTDSFTFTADDGAVVSAPATVSITITPAVTGPKLYLGSSTSGTAGGVAFADEDMLIKDMGSGAWSMYIDGSDIGLANTDIDAFELQGDGSLLLSFDTAFTLSGFGAVDDSDILRFTPTSTGATTAGTWSWYFDGSDVGLTTSDEDVDAFALLPDGRLVISTLGNVSVTGASGADEDLLAFTPTALSATTTGTWALYFDGSDVGLSNTSNEDVNGVWVDAAGKIYLTTLGAFSVTGVSGDGSDIITCTPDSLGGNTTCAWAMYWDGSVQGFSGEDTDSLSIAQ